MERTCPKCKERIPGEDAKGDGVHVVFYCDNCRSYISDLIKKPDCDRCNDKGWFYVPNGPDDVDKEICDCQEVE